MFKRLKAKLLRQKPLDEEEILAIYIKASQQMKIAPLFAKDFVRLVEEKHGITGKYTVEPQTYD